MQIDMHKNLCVGGGGGIRKNLINLLGNGLLTIVLLAITYTYGLIVG